MMTDALAFQIRTRLAISSVVNSAARYISVYAQLHYRDGFGIEMAIMTKVFIDATSESSSTRR